MVINQTVPKLCPSRSNISKQFQTKPKVSWKIGIESTGCNYNIFEFSKIWSENPRVGSSILSLGTFKIKGLISFVNPFFVRQFILPHISPTFFKIYNQ